MKKSKVTVAAILSLAAFMPLQSCIGSFALTNRVLSWNKQVGSKFVNELVFFAFWVLPVYEVTSIADLLVLNSIEFWSGNNPVDTASTKAIDTEQGRYFIACDQKGYTVTAPNGDEMRLEFETDTQTWSFVSSTGEILPFMTMIDDNHVKMITPAGDFRMVELSQEGVMAYRGECAKTFFALTEI
ncbi:MAG: DUF3332 domain-containing protein [Muribaculaceae bacterium]|nr:DUF3332 domain-containing protein [Muribaculaceae bacterium]MDE6299308.1 DUF3332 domain-containing protein [Muribaculaceae bacterium]